MKNFFSNLLKAIGIILLGAIFGGTQGASIVATVIIIIYLYLAIARIFVFIISLLFPIKNNNSKVKEIKNTQEPKSTNNNDSLRNAYLHYALSGNHHGRGECDCDHHDH